MLSPPHRQSNVAFPTEGPSEASPPPSPDRPVPESQSQTRVRQRSTFGGMRRQQPDRQAHLPPRGPCSTSSGEDEARRCRFTTSHRGTPVAVAGDRPRWRSRFSYIPKYVRTYAVLRMSPGETSSAPIVLRTIPIKRGSLRALCRRLM